MKIKFSIILFILFWQLQAQDLPKINAVADTTSIRMGEQIKLQVNVQADTLSFIDFPEISELGDMEVVGTGKTDTLQAKPFQKLRKEYYLTQWDSGVYVVPPLSVRVQDSVLQTDSLRIKVLPVKIDTIQQGLYDFKPLVNIKGQERTDEDNSLSVWWLLLLLLLPLAYFLFKRRKEIFKTRKKLSPYEKAVAQLNKLKDKKNWLKGKVDVHYLDLTDTLKDYLESELHLSAKEKLSSQILELLRQYHFENNTYISPELLNRLKETFSRADLAKFAKLEPNPADVELDFSVIKDFINSSHKVIQEIEDLNKAEIAQRKAAKKRKKRIALGITLGILLLVGLLVGVSYYYINKSGLAEHLKENIQEAEWVINEYGGEPALELQTPHILHSFDLSKISDSIPVDTSKMNDVVSFYYDKNIVKKYVILEGNIDIKKEIDGQAIIYAMLMNLKARDINMQQADVGDAKKYFGTFTADLPVIGKNLQVAFDSRIFNNKGSTRMVIGFYLQNDKKNRELIEKVMDSANLTGLNE